MRASQRAFRNRVTTPDRAPQDSAKPRDRRLGGIPRSIVVQLAEAD